MKELLYRISHAIRAVGLASPTVGEENDSAFAKVADALEALVIVAKAAERHPFVSNLLTLDDERFDDYQDRDQQLIDALDALDIQHDEDVELEEAQ